MQLALPLFSITNSDQQKIQTLMKLVPCTSLKLFLIFRDVESSYSYRLYSYKQVFNTYVSVRNVVAIVQIFGFIPFVQCFYKLFLSTVLPRNVSLILTDFDI